MKTAISERGQVTIPKPVRERLGLYPGCRLRFAAVDGKLVGRKLVTGDVLAKWRGRGRLPGARSVDEYLARVRG